MSRPPRRPPPRHTVAVEIAGEKHVLRSDVPPEYTRRVAAHVDATIRALPGFQTLEPFRAATLAALSITDELFRARDELRRLRDETDRRSAELADLLEAAEGAAAERRPIRRPAAASFTIETREPVPPPVGVVSAVEPSRTSEGSSLGSADAPLRPQSPRETRAAVAPESSADMAAEDGDSTVSAAGDPQPGGEADAPPLPRDDAPAWMEDAAARIEARPKREAIQDELELPPPE